MAQSASDHGAAEASMSFPPFDPSTFGSQLVWLVISFVLLYWIMSKFALPQISDIIEVRRDRILSDLDEAERLKSESEKVTSDYELTLTQARKKSHETISFIREKNQAEILAEQAQIDIQLEQKTEKAETRIHEMHTQIMSEIASMSEDLASDIVERFISKKPTKAVLSKAIKSVSNRDI